MEQQVKDKVIEFITSFEVERVGKMNLINGLVQVYEDGENFLALNPRDNKVYFDKDMFFPVDFDFHTSEEVWNKSNEMGLAVMEREKSLTMNNWVENFNF